MDITIHPSFLPHNDPDASRAFYRDIRSGVDALVLAEGDPGQRQSDGRRATPADTADQLDSGPLPRPRRRR